MATEIEIEVPTSIYDLPNEVIRHEIFDRLEYEEQLALGATDMVLMKQFLQLNPMKEVCLCTYSKPMGYVPPTSYRDGYLRIRLVMNHGGEILIRPLAAMLQHSSSHLQSVTIDNMLLYKGMRGEARTESFRINAKISRILLRGLLEGGFHGDLHLMLPLGMNDVETAYIREIVEYTKGFAGHLGKMTLVLHSSEHGMMNFGTAAERAHMRKGFVQLLPETTFFDEVSFEGIETADAEDNMGQMFPCDGSWKSLDLGGLVLTEKNHGVPVVLKTLQSLSFSADSTFFNAMLVQAPMLENLALKLYEKDTSVHTVTRDMLDRIATSFPQLQTLTLSFEGDIIEMNVDGVELPRLKNLVIKIPSWSGFSFEELLRSISQLLLPEVEDIVLVIEYARGYDLVCDAGSASLRSLTTLKRFEVTSMGPDPIEVLMRDALSDDVVFAFEDLGEGSLSDYLWSSSDDE